jgi:hypothetical protein
MAHHWIIPNRNIHPGSILGKKQSIAIIAAVAGLGVIGALVGYFGAATVLHSLLAIGWRGFAAICLIHLAVIAVEGIAWRLLVPGIRFWVFVWGRLLRDAGSEVLPVSQMDDPSRKLQPCKAEYGWGGYKRASWRLPPAKVAAT